MLILEQNANHCQNPTSAHKDAWGMHACTLQENDRLILEIFVLIFNYLFHPQGPKTPKWVIKVSITYPGDPIINSSEFRIINAGSCLQF